MSESETSEVASRVAALASAKVPLPEGLRALALEMSLGRPRAALLELANQLERGNSLEDALDRLGSRFPSYFRALLETGRKSGRLPEVLSQYVGYCNLSGDLQRRLLLGLAYPLLLVISIFVLVIVVSYLVKYGFEQIYSDFGIAIPVMTQVLLQVASLVSAGGWRFPIGLLAIVGLLAFGWWSILSPLTKRRVLCSLPIFGKLWRWSALSEFCHLLALLLEGGVPLPRALPLAAEGAGDLDLTSVCHKIAGEVESGQALDSSISQRAWMFPEGLAALLRWGAGHSTLPQVLHMAGEMFAALARSQTSYLGSFLTIFLVIMALWGVAFLVIALFLPLITLISRLSG